MTSLSAQDRQAIEEARQHLRNLLRAATDMDAFIASTALHTDHAALNAMSRFHPAQAEAERSIDSLSAILERSPYKCDHEWIDIRNEFVLSGEMCRKCNAIRAGNVATDPEEKNR